jgi:hypothetical protein
MRLQLSSRSARSTRLRILYALPFLLALEGAALARTPTVTASTELAGYTDSMHVHVASPSLGGTLSDEAAGWSVGGRYLVDVVSAASVDIVATASPRWNELRHVGSIEASYKRGAASATASAGISEEPDYRALYGSAGFTLDLLEKNLTPFLSARYGHDDVGRRGLPRERWEALQKGGLQAGLTFVLSRFMVASVQLDADFERGYLAKPYRYIPLFSPGTGAEIPAGAPPRLVNELRLDERPIDSLPTSRDRYALTGRLAARKGHVTLRLDQRLYTDSWGLGASTSDARVLVDAGSRFLLWPRLRFHTQSGVSFWQRAYEAVVQEDGTLLVPRYRTGDRELSRLDTLTAGLGIKLRLGRDAHAPIYLSYQLDAAYTWFRDALYVTQRWSVFSALGMSATWN